MPFFRRLLSPVALQAPESLAGSFALQGRDVPYRLIRSRKRRRTLSMSVESDGSLLIRVPLRATTAAVHRFVEARSAWVLRRLDILRDQQSAPVLRRFESGEQLLFRGEICTLHVARESSVTGCAFAEGKLTVSVGDIWLSGKDLRDEVRFELISWYKKQARTVFAERLDYWSARLGLAYKKLVVSDPRSLWGSCDAQNIIHLNWRLAMAPSYVLDYVVVHELCHILHRNHSPRFWRAVEKALPDYAATRKYLRNNAYLYFLPS